MENVECKCGEDESCFHTCPYATEIYDDYTECNCCLKCEKECADDI